VPSSRAIALDPELILADEPTSALDASTQARILDLIHALPAELRFACLFISHNLAVIEQFADRVAVTYRGRIIELGPTASVLGGPRHPYTQCRLDKAVRGGGLAACGPGLGAGSGYGA